MATRTNEITQGILKWLNSNGFICWRNNNGAVFSRKRNCYLKNPTHKIGVPDIIGYKKASKTKFFPIFLAIEIKTGKDKLSFEQEYFIKEVLMNNGIAFVAKDFDNFHEQIKKYL